MAVAKRVFRASVKSWLKGIAGVSSTVGTRVYSGLVPMPPTLPFVLLSNEWRPVADIEAPAWHGQLTVDIYGSDTDRLNAIEDAIEDDMHRDPADGTLEAVVPSSGVTACKHFRYERTAPDRFVYEADEGDNVYGYAIRTMEFTFVLVGLS